MFLVKDWEMFYTKSKKGGDKVDQISINVDRKIYVLQQNVTSFVCDGEDEQGEEINSLPVSRFVFDIIVEGVKSKGFDKVKNE